VRILASKLKRLVEKGYLYLYKNKYYPRLKGGSNKSVDVE